MNEPGEKKTRTRRSNAVLVKPPPPNTSRGRATRERLMSSVADLLKERTYYDIRIEDITGRAGVRAGLFYHYFQSKADVTQEVLQNMLSAYQQEVVSRKSRAGSPLEAIHYANQLMVALYSANPGAMRCLVEVREDGTPFAEMWRALTFDWNRRIASSIARQFPCPGVGEAGFLALAYALSGAVDSFLFEYFVQKTPALRSAYPTDEAVAGFLTTLWYRAVYLKNPPIEFSGPRPELAFFQGLKFEQTDPASISDSTTTSDAVSMAAVTRPAKRALKQPASSTRAKRR